MALFSANERPVAAAIAGICAANPFRPERIALEREALGESFVGGARVRARTAYDAHAENAARLLERAEGLLAEARARLSVSSGRRAPSTLDDDELHLVQGLVFYVLYYRFEERLAALAARASQASHVDVPWFATFRQEAEALSSTGRGPLPAQPEPVHLLAILFQIARAYHQIHASILGTSDAAIELRAAVWESIFTHDVMRYQRSLYRHMADLTTLVTGPSGTGKELVARAIGTSCYVVFDERNERFPTQDLFLPLNLTALSPQLLESELFGHRRGAFTGALADRKGWFEICPPHGTVFLDEIGEIESSIQVKLLRVLQTRSFQRLGATSESRFAGKLVSATNRDLGDEMAAGRFREDLYYRLCSDRIVTPSLAEQIAGSSDELRHLISFLALRLVDDEAEAFTQEAVAWIETHLGLAYAWPGNFRELEQCVRNLLLRGSYRPETPREAGSTRDTLAKDFLDACIDADTLLRRYCTLAYARIGTYDGAARELGLDRRTVRAKVDASLLERL